MEGRGSLNYLVIMNSEGKDLDGLNIRSENKKSTELSINTEAIDSMLFGLEQFKMETWVFGVLRKKPKLFLEFGCKVMFPEKLLNLRIKRQDF